MPNHLIHENSPYLLQHANNPVDWFPWGREALEKARKEEKPIFLSIGYAACHWCHVMAHESFENAETAAFMNEHFVNIKVDREERPDLDSIYMSATTAMTGSGGWPMSVFLTPDLQPFYAGTYFPPARRYNMPSFLDVLHALATTWRDEREKALHSAGRVLAHIRQQASLSQYELALSGEHLDLAVRNLLEAYDWGYGGWGGAPKFPQPMTIEFLLRRHAGGNPDALKPALHALKTMARGGMHDVVGGGFARYSTDTFWRVPHFEKMLYDNAQLARAYLHAWQITGDPSLHSVVTGALDFIAREMTHSQGGFYSSLDADSENQEGKYYIWKRDEIRELLSEESVFFEAAYGITEQGNWEGVTVLQRALDDKTLASRFGVTPEEVFAKLEACHGLLLAARVNRIRPATDDKVLTAWNGFALAALAEAARFLGEPGKREQYYTLAARNADFLLTALRPGGKLCRSWRAGRTTGEVVLEDFAALILGLLELYQTDFNERWFASAQELADEMIARFSDQSGGFFDTPADGEALVLRPKDLQDNATPSGNALACEALLTLAAFTGKNAYRDQAEKALGLVAEAAVRTPTAFARWLSAADHALGHIKQVAALGNMRDPDFQAILEAIRKGYKPAMVVAASAYPPSQAAPALLADRPLLDGKATVFVCEGFVCNKPVTEVEQLKELLD